MDLGPRKNRLILAVLALEVNRPVPLARLIDLAWPGSPPRTAPNAVMVAISQLRKALRQADAELFRRGDGYALCTDPVQVDAHEFRLLVQRARSAPDADRIALLDRALLLWRGPALDGSAPAEIRDRLCCGLEEARQTAIEDRFDAKLRLGEHRELIGELTGQVTVNPAREYLVRQLMLALYRSGRATEALAVYRATRERLASALGLDPGPELQALETAILRDDPAIAAPTPGVVPLQAAKVPAPAQLPPSVGALAGRAAELAAMDTIAGPPGGAAAIIVLTGTAGVGKTTLAIHWAQRARNRFPDGQIYVNLRGFDPHGPAITAAEALRGLLDAFELPQDSIPQDLPAQTALFRSTLAGRRIFILLDNARDADQVRPLLPSSPGCVTVVTSRTHLTGLIAAEGAMPVDLDLPTPEDARELLEHRLGAARVSAEPEAVDDLVARCGRLPLALAVVAARAATRPRLPLRALADQLRAAQDRLDALDGDDPTTNVRTVLSWSYRSLRADAARLFRLLSSHPGPDLAAPGAASQAGLALDETQTLLAELRAAHLLSEPAPGRFAFHDLLRAYAAELAADEDPVTERESALHRTLDHYLHTAVRAAMILSPNRIPITPTGPVPGVHPEELADATAATAWLRNERAVLLDAVQRSFDGRFDTHAWQLAWAMANPLGRAGRWQEWADTQRVGLAAARRQGDQWGQANTHRSLGRALGWLRRYDDGYDHLRHAIRLFAELGDTANQAQAHLGVSWLFDQQGRHREALAEDQVALDLYAAAGNRAGHATALSAVAWDLAQLGDHERGIACSRQALQLQQELGDLHGQDASWNSLGYAHHKLGQYAHAAAAYESAVSCAREAGNRYSEAHGLRHLGDVQAESGQLTAARHSWLTALAILDELGHSDAAVVRARLAPVTDDGSGSGG
ncbi:BTAD domain-containing putative transcriptional regulator [Krasilnikovia sp. MM14-A1259]|uniref:AfsR/SARP family transcriptional regulator n=1 Tax=Krasilnikovia sp. MM14-A1259 TaxID=3373539 RepID=UPI00399C6C77